MDKQNPNSTTLKEIVIFLLGRRNLALPWTPSQPGGDGALVGWGQTEEGPEVGSQVGNEGVGDGGNGENSSSLVKCRQQGCFLAGWEHPAHPAQACQWTGTLITTQVEKRRAGYAVANIECLSFESGEGNGNPLQYSCLENLRDGGAWWAAILGVAQSRTRLKRLSCSSSI